ncbi:MAG: alpha/beta fold hydrolase [Acidimicrobiales bacterium]
MTENPNAAPPILLLIHGLGATPGVWDGLVESVDWSGPVLTPPLPGHGSGAWNGDYSVSALARAVASSVSERRPVLAVGHSLGGAVGVELASGRYQLPVVGVLGLGIKTTWTDDDVAGMAKVAGRGVRWFPTREEAVARFLRSAGLDQIVDPDHPAVTDAVVEAPEGAEGADHDEAPGWRVAQDPATFAQEPVDMRALLDAAQCPVWLGAGEHDAMATEAELSAFTDTPLIATDRGHNVQVEDPIWVASLIERLAATVLK